MRCLRCGLPDPYRGQGDGIGSCDCSRCECCAAGPDECECEHERDEIYDDPDEPWDYLCSDSSCYHLLHRLARRAATAAGGAEGDQSKGGSNA